MLTYDHAFRASQGARPYQEDSAAVWPGDGPLTRSLAAIPPADTRVLAVLADGMGGHVGGAMASNLVCSTLLETYAKASDAVPRRLALSLDEANLAIRREGQAKPQLMGMGATAVAVAFCVDGAHWISVGDSPLYLYRNGELTRVNEDHSLAPLLDRLVAEGKMDAEDAKNDHRRHYLRSAVTGEEIELIDASEKPLAVEAGDILLLASDGILTLVDDDIRRTLQEQAAQPAAAIAERLVHDVDAANEPHQDNTTVIVVKVLAGTMTGPMT